MLLIALTGKGLQVDKHRIKRSLLVYCPSPNSNPPTAKLKGGLIYPPMMPPFNGTWEKPIGMGIKNLSRKAKKGSRPFRPATKPSMEQSSSSRSVDIKFIDKPLSNFDLFNFVKHLKIKYFKGVFSRDKLPNMISKEYGIINLDDQIGAGTHWVAYRNIDKYCEYL